MSGHGAVVLPIPMVSIFALLLAPVAPRAHPAWRRGRGLQLAGCSEFATLLVSGAFHESLWWFHGPESFRVFTVCEPFPVTGIGSACFLAISLLAGLHAYRLAGVPVGLPPPALRLPLGADPSGLVPRGEPPRSPGAGAGACQASPSASARSERPLPACLAPFFGGARGTSAEAAPA